MIKIFSLLLFFVLFVSFSYIKEFYLKKNNNESSTIIESNKEIITENNIQLKKINAGRYYFGKHIECSNGNMFCLEKIELNKFCINSKLSKSGKESAVRTDRDFSGNSYALYHLAEFGEINYIKISYSNDKSIQCVVNFNISGIYKGTSYNHSIKSCANEFAVKADGEILITDASPCRD